MGLYRFILAVMVAASHVNIRFHGYNPGVIAVISFYLLSGYVMTMLIEKHYKYPSGITTFYLDRAMRLFPQFLFYTILSSSFIYFYDVDSPFTNKLNAVKWMLNFFILPQGFFMWWADGALVIPQSWSLGLEFTFYLVIPWILVYFSKRQFYFLAGMSFIIFFAAYIGKINTDYYGYRLLPGTLFMFLVGSSFFCDDKSSRKFRITIGLAAGAMLLTAFLNEPLYQLPYNKEVLIGLLVGISAISFIKRSNFSKIDEFLGNISYGIFLNHFILIWGMQKFLNVKSFGFGNTVILLAASCILALGSFYYVERPALKFRHTLRYGTGNTKTVR